MATHRSIPGANVPASDSTMGNKDEFGQDNGPARSDLGTELPGETGLGSGFGANTGGFGAGDSFATLPTSDAYGDSGVDSADRQYPRPVGVLDQVKQQASTRVNEQKVRAAAGLGTVASAIREASEHLRSENETLAAYADTAVNQLQTFADRMRDKQPAEMMRDVERFARRNPAAFLGGAFLLGIGMARFLKSSGNEPNGGRRLSHRDSTFGDSSARDSEHHVGAIVAGPAARAEAESR